MFNDEVKILSFNKYNLNTHYLPGRVLESGWTMTSQRIWFLLWSYIYLTRQVPSKSWSFRQNRISEVFLVFVRFLTQSLTRPFGS